MSNNKYNIGYTSCYINDHAFDHKTDIPVEAAIEWVKKTLPDQQMGNGITASELTSNGDRKTDVRENGWLNKLFVIVAFEHGKFVALCNQDGKFSVRIET